MNGVKGSGQDERDEQDEKILVGKGFGTQLSVAVLPSAC
jgi:hypothetical protein